MPAQSAGLLPYRVGDGRILEVLVVHPGGPFWAGKDDGAWSIAKGEYSSGEDPEEAASREFAEELGRKPPAGVRIDLGELRQPSGKTVRVWAVAGDVDVEDFVSNTFDLEWPPHSGETTSFPEIDRAAWISAATARRKLLKGQVGFVDRLVTRLRDSPAGDFSEGT
ncbi:MAG TPA: NUDIX domain-containing protein [Acidimicrobiales bacterium]|nr:NUDIX domain-containing protein [Acidimicrobiales bacterium]HLN06972.1 NUDIX domain-containing protein [Acidimicrobiales bacterium]